MRFVKIWSRGFRSLRDVTLDGLGPFNIFYGPNGAGKSNVLAAIKALVGCVAVLNSAANAWQLGTQDREGPTSRSALFAAGKDAFDSGAISSADFSADAPLRTFSIGACVAGDNGDFALLGRPFAQLSIEIEMSEILIGEPRLVLRHLTIDGVEATRWLEGLPRALDPVQALLARFTEDFAVIPADRSPRREVGPALTQRRDPVRDYLQEGNLKRALFAASTSVDPRVRGRLREFRRLMVGPPLNRPPFDAVRDPETDAYDIREPLGTTDVSIDLAGLGVAQAYSILAGIMLSGADAVAIEEPEAHLHAPSLGIHVRELLLRLVSEGFVQQLFLATHSNLFDLDPEGYWDVSLREGATCIERKPLDEIDARHLYEPGPAKHALAQLLRYAPEDEVIFRRPEGGPVTAREMLELLQKDDLIAVDFLRNLHGAALRVVRLDARKKVSPS